jgi:hypothetical protein
VIEVTDEMVQLVYEQIDFVNHGDDGIREGLAAVLAIIERDHALLPYCNAELMPGVVCKLDKNLGHAEHRARMPGGNPVSWS